jgi:hypothetical protein
MKVLAPALRTMLCIISISLTIGLLSGCSAAGTVYDDGVRMENYGHLDGAIQQYTMAVELKPSTKLYQTALRRVRKKQATHYLKLAQTASSEKQLATAERHLKKSLAYSSSASARTLQSNIRQNIEKAESMRKRALTTSSNGGKWEDRISLMRKAAEINEQMPNAQTDIATLVDGACTAYLEQARLYLNQGRWADCEKAARRVYTHKPDCIEAKEFIAEVQRRSKASELVAKAKGLLKKWELNVALTDLQKAEKLFPGCKETAQLIAKVKDDICRRDVAKGRILSKQGKHAEAFYLFQFCQTLRPEYKGLDELAEQARTRLININVLKAQAYAKKGLVANAFLHNLIVLSYDDTHPDANEWLMLCGERLRGRLCFSAGMLPVQATVRRYQVVAERLEAMLLENLTEDDIRNLQFLDQDDLKRVAMAAQARAKDGQAPLPDHRVHAVIRAKIMYGRVSTKRDHVKAASKYQNGFISKLNPERKKVEAEVQKAEKAHASAVEAAAAARAISGLTSAMAGMGGTGNMIHTMGAMNNAGGSMANAGVTTSQNRLNIARQKLANTPTRVPVPKYVTHSYNVNTITQTAKVRAYVKILDTGVRRPLLVKTLTGTWMACDKYIKEDSGRNVPGDPLELPEDEEMFEKALTSIANTICAAIRKAYDEHSDRFVKDAVRATKRRRFDEAAENALNYLLIHPKDGAQTKAMHALISKRLGAEKKLLDIQKLLEEQGDVIW